MDKVKCLKRLTACLSGKSLEEINGSTICKILDQLCECIDSGNNITIGQEIDTGKRWIDGKPIYKLVINATIATLAGYINNYNPDTIVSVFGQAYCHTTNNFVCIPSTTMGAASYNIDFLQNATDKTVTINFGSYFNGEHQAFCIVEYTKKSEA